MGQAKQRKLAGTYPIQDGGPWRYYDWDSLKTMGPDERKVLDAMLDVWLKEELMGQEAVKAAGSIDEARLAILSMFEHGFMMFAMRFLKDDVQFRVELTTPAEAPAG